MARVLIVEDDVQMNELVCSYLIDNGYDAQGCFNGFEAFQILMKNLST